MSKKINPMRPANLQDIVPGWIYEIVMDWRQTAASAPVDYRTGKPNPKGEDCVHLTYANTLGDARFELEIQAERYLNTHQQLLRRMGPNRYHGNDGDTIVNLSIIAVQDSETKENI